MKISMTGNKKVNSAGQESRLVKMVGNLLVKPTQTQGDFKDEWHDQICLLSILCIEHGKTESRVMKSGGYWSNQDTMVTWTREMRESRLITKITRR